MATGQAADAPTPPDVETAIEQLLQLIDTFDNYEIGGEDGFTFGDLRMLINFAERALGALSGSKRA